MKLKLRQRSVHIQAPRELVFQMLSAMGSGQMPGAEGESARVLSRDGDTLIVHFVTHAEKRVVNTVEEVRLYPPERITFQHIAGPLDYSWEEMKLSEEEEDGTLLEYSGEFEYIFPGLGWLISLAYIRPKYNATIQEHLARLKAAAEARAARSHVFRQRQSATFKQKAAGR